MQPLLHTLVGTLDDLHELHAEGAEVLFWCRCASDAGTESCVGFKQCLKEAEATVSKHSWQKCEVESVYDELSEKHQQTWDVPMVMMYSLL